MFPISSPRVPSTCGSSLVTPVARTEELDAGASAACHASPATPACHVAAAPPHATPAAEVDQSAAAMAGSLPRSHPALLHVLPLPRLPSGHDRVLPALPAFSAAAAAASAGASHPSFHTADTYQSCPLYLRGNCEGARALFGPGHDDWGRPIANPSSAFCGRVLSRRGVRVSYVPTTSCPVCFLRLEGLGLRLRKQKKLGTSVCGLSSSAACEDQNSVRAPGGEACEGKNSVRPCVWQRGLRRSKLVTRVWRPRTPNLVRASAGAGIQV